MSKYLKCKQMYKLLIGLCCLFCFNVGAAQGRRVTSTKPTKTRTNRTKPSTGNTNSKQRSLVDKEKMADLRAEIREELKTNPPTSHRTIDLFNNQFDTYIVDLSNRQQELNMFFKDDKGLKYYSFENIKRASNQKFIELAFAMNAGMYNSSFEPVGLLMQDGHPERGLDRNTSGRGNFYLKPNGIFLINKTGKAEIVTTEDFANRQMASNTQHATQSGPMLLIDGQYHPVFNPNSNNLNIRNGVGVIDENRVVFIISRSGVTFYDFATVFKEVFDCENALFLDGAVSKMYCPELGLNDTSGRFGAMIGLVRNK